MWQERTKNTQSLKLGLSPGCASYQPCDPEQILVCAVKWASLRWVWPYLPAFRGEGRVKDNMGQAPGTMPGPWSLGRQLLFLPRCLRC